jgi:hypothetical protein
MPFELLSFGDSGKRLFCKLLLPFVILIEGKIPGSSRLRTSRIVERGDGKPPKKIERKECRRGDLNPYERFKLTSPSS